MPTSPSQPEHLIDVAEQALLLTGADPEIAAVHVVLGRRPSFDEVLHLREAADPGRVSLAVQGDGSLTIRKSIPIEQASGADTGGRWVGQLARHCRRDWETVRDWVVARGQARDAGFEGVSESPR